MPEFQLVVPANTKNSRFYHDLYARHRPALTFTGFDNGGDSRYGLGLKQVIERSLNGRSLENQLIRRLTETAILDLRKREEANSKMHGVNHNTEVFQARSFVALLSLLLEHNQVLIPDVKVIAHKEALEEMMECFKVNPSTYPMFAYEVESGIDRVKWTRSLMNMARAFDLYLALENAYTHYEMDTSILLKQEEKDAFLDRYGKGIKEVLEIVDSDLGVGSYISGNWSLKMWVAAAYGCLGAQNRGGKEEKDFRGWFGRGLRRAGPGNPKDKRRYWTYMTAQKVGGAYQDGQRTWAEGPYYMHYALHDVIPFWHAIRAQGYLKSPEHDVDYSDPFHSKWFTAPLEWLADITTPEGGTPPFDDGNRKIMNYVSLMSWSDEYGDRSVSSKMKGVSDLLFASKDGIPTNWGLVDWNTFITQLAIPQADKAMELPEKVGNYTARDLSEEQLIVRRTLQGQTHYICLHGEGSNDSIWRGEGHEQPDQLQLLYYLDEHSLIMDAGYDRGHVIKNSSWNRYTDHNVMAFEKGDSGLKSPHRVTKKVSHTPVDYLYFDPKSSDRLPVMKGHLVLTWRNKKRTFKKGHRHETDGLYARTVLFVADDTHPYLIDVNQVSNQRRRGSMPRLKMRYHVDSNQFMSKASDTWYHWRFEKKPDLFLYFQTVEFNRSNSSVSLESVQVEEQFRSREPVKRFTYRGGKDEALTTVGVFQARITSPGSHPTPLIPRTSRKPLTHQVWQWKHSDKELIDVLLVRSSIDEFLREQAISTTITLPDNTTRELVCRGLQDIGFARFGKEGDTWMALPEYLYNLELIRERLVA